MVDAKDLLELVAKALVDRPDDVEVTESEDDGAVVLELRVGPDDVGKIIGKQGRTVRALRSLVRSVGAKKKHRFVLEIIE